MEQNSTGGDGNGAKTLQHRAKTYARRTWESKQRRVQRDYIAGKNLGDVRVRVVNFSFQER